MIKGINAERALEIGCGYGRLTPWVAEYASKYYDVEPEEELYKIAKELYPNFSFFNNTANKLPFHDKYFDLIFTWTVLQHIYPKYFSDSIKEILCVVK